MGFCVGPRPTLQIFYHVLQTDPQKVKGVYSESAKFGYSYESEQKVEMDSKTGPADIFCEWCKILHVDPENRRVHLLGQADAAGFHLRVPGWVANAGLIFE